MEPTVRAAGYRMGWMGAQRDVLAGDLRPRADLREFATVPHLHALGPLEGLCGEVTVIEGAPLISTVTAGAVAVARGFAHRACFLVYAEVPRWQWTEIGARLASLAALDPILERTAAASGLDAAVPFPFRVTGRAETGTFHVLDKRDGLPHNPARHEEAKVRFDLGGQDVELIGFRSSGHQGVFVPGGSTMHVHMTAQGGRLAGHVDALALTRGGRLALPAAPGPEDAP